MLKPECLPYYNHPGQSSLCTPVKWCKLNRLQTDCRIPAATGKTLWKIKCEFNLYETETLRMFLFPFLAFWISRGSARKTLCVSITLSADSLWLIPCPHDCFTFSWLSILWFIRQFKVACVMMEQLSFSQMPGPLAEPYKSPGHSLSACSYCL